VDSTVLQFFKNIEHGVEGESYRNSSVFTEYDGLVHVESDVLDPRVNKEKHVSAAKLEMIAKCPYSYFLQDVLKLRPIEDIEYNPSKWLDAATRGSLLHSIFENFYKEIKEEKPSFEKHEEGILTLANKLIDEQKELIPPPNERVFQKEVRDILDCCRIFLKEEEAHCESYKPKYFEYTFGLGEHEPAVITLPSGAAINVAGKIDRVDEADSGHFHIIDYKTGSTYGYGNKQIFKGGRQLQHMIYALAIEQHLNLESGKVQESAYYFPTVKGLAERVVRKQDEVVRTNGLDILERLIDVLKTGTFTMTDDENDCKFCEFKTVCRRHFYEKEVLEVKQSDKDREVLKRFKGVRAYE
jgi:ATP-dependent helicase/DNAse subunit B